MLDLPPQDIVRYDEDREAFYISLSLSSGQTLESSITREELNASFSKALKTYGKEV